MKLVGMVLMCIGVAIAIDSTVYWYKNSHLTEMQLFQQRFWNYAASVGSLFVGYFIHEKSRK